MIKFISNLGFKIVKSVKLMHLSYLIGSIILFLILCLTERYSGINEKKKDISNRIVFLHVKNLSKIDAQSSGGQSKLNYTREFYSSIL